MSKARVSLVRGDNRRQMIFEALDKVRDQVTPKLREQVMLKPNFLSKDNQLASSHADALRGALDFLLSTPTPPSEVIIAEGGNEDFSGQAFENFGYGALVNEYPISIELVDLNQETRWRETPIILADGSETTVRMPLTVLECPCTISMAIPKTHDVCVVTLALKNMIMGTIAKPDRVFMHGFPNHDARVLPDEAQVLNINLIRLARFLTPDIAVIDGARGLQGNGPGGTDGVDFGVAAASADCFAADAVMTKAMGFTPSQMGLLHYAGEVGLGAVNLDEIEIVGVQPSEVMRQFKPHEDTHLQLQWQREDAMVLLATSSTDYQTTV